jgi:serine/threonine protein kinase
MGVVYKCHDTVLDRVVAVKQMVAEIDDDPQLRKRFTQEARSAARLNHGNIITIYELHETESQLAIVMELLEGVDLATLIKHQTPLPLEAKLNMIAQVCDGLDYAHARGIVHRDIKPANLHVSPAGVVKLLDFGIARLASSKMTSTGGLIGTPDYMSPEQVMAGDVDARSDLFAIGAVLYELIAGAKPFKAESITALLMQIVREPHTPLFEQVPDLPAGVADLVERLLRKDPDERPATARQVHDALMALSTDRPLFDASTVSTLARAVTDETLRPRTPRPPSRVSAVRSVSATPAEASSSKLASLAIDQGRALRQAGDLAGAMKVFRSVLELAPGNHEALAELEEMERAFANLTATRPASPAAPPIAADPAAVAASTSTMPGTTPLAAGSRERTRQGLLAAAALVLLVVIGGAVYLWTSRADDTADASALQPLPMPALPDQASPTATMTPNTTPEPAPGAPASVEAPAPPATPAPSPVPGRSAGAAAPPAGTRVQTPAVSPPSPSPPPVAEATPAPDVPAVPPVAAAEPPEPEPPTPPKPSTPAVIVEATVRHYHGRSLRRGLSRGYCDGTLRLLADGLSYQTSTTSDGRKDSVTLTVRDIEEIEIEGNRIFIETEEQNWEFGGSVDQLKQVEQHLRANRKKEG